MLTVSKTCSFDAAHLLGGHAGQCRNLHGHTYRVTVEVGADPRTPGAPDDMVIDFKELKSIMAVQITERFDHAFMYCEQGAVEVELAEVLKRNGLKVVALPFRTTSENLARHFYELLRPFVPVVSVIVSETAESAAKYESSAS